MDLQLPVHHLAEYDHPQLIKFSNTIVNELMSITHTGEDDLPLFRDLLLLGKADEECRQVFLLKEEGKALLFTMRELLSEGIKNLVTTDASRETRSVFSFSAKPVKIYDVQNFKNYGKLTINAIEFQSGLTQIKKSCKDTKTPNPYLLALKEILQIEREARKEILDRKNKKKPKEILVFHSKQVELRDKAELFLWKNGITEDGDMLKFHFETFGRENATNQYRDCECVIFMGLHHKPSNALKALLLGEMAENRSFISCIITLHPFFLV